MNGLNRYVRLCITFCLFLSGVLSIKVLIASIFVALIFSHSTFAEEAVDIRKLMTAYEFQETGLNTLNEKQVQALNLWLINFTANEAPILKEKNSSVKEAEKTSVVSQLDGEFMGLTGKTKFFLKNGQVWQQRVVETWSSPTINEPNVEIRQNFMGFHVMEIKGLKRSVRVKRIE